MCLLVQSATVVQTFLTPFLICTMTGQSRLRIPLVGVAETEFVNRLMEKTVKLVLLIVLLLLLSAVVKERQ